MEKGVGANDEWYRQVREINSIPGGEGRKGEAREREREGESEGKKRREWESEWRERGRKGCEGRRKRNNCGIYKWMDG